MNRVDAEKIISLLEQILAKLESLESKYSAPVYAVSSAYPEGICPTCHGLGNVPNPDPGSNAERVPCQACGGSGWK